VTWTEIGIGSAGCASMSGLMVCHAAAPHEVQPAEPQPLPPPLAPELMLALLMRVAQRVLGASCHSVCLDPRAQTWMTSRHRHFLDQNRGSSSCHSAHRRRTHQTQAPAWKRGNTGGIRGAAHVHAQILEMWLQSHERTCLKRAPASVFLKDLYSASAVAMSIVLGALTGLASPQSAMPSQHPRT
jgi:hypothetical protein